MYRIYDTAAIKYNYMDTGNSIVDMFIVKVCSCYSIVICIPASSLDIFDPKGSSPCDVWCMLCRKGLHTQTGCLYAHDYTYCKNFKLYVRMYQHCNNRSVHVVFCACSIKFVILTV